MSHPRTMVIIVNYKVGDLVVDCLRSLQNEVFEQGEQVAEVLVVDNQSGDDSVAVMRQAIEANRWQSWARVVESPVNGGFAYGNNVALRDAKARGARYEHVWFLNPDTVARPGALRELTKFLDAHPKVGLVGSRVEEDDGGTVWPYAFRFHSILGELEAAMQLGVVTKLLSRFATAMKMGNEPRQVQWLSGCTFAVRGKVFDDVGLMDEEFFLYYEETDFCKRAHLAGWDCWYVPASRVYHISGRSTGVSGEGSSARRLPAYWFESRRRYFMKHHGRAYTVAADIAWVIGFSIWRLRRKLQRKPDMDPPQYRKDFIRHSAIFNGDIPTNDRLRSPVPTHKPSTA
jgi:N-acetylglucosaminyl-diphospho-decaprenol L-rhamnosyltransferase